MFNLLRLLNTLGNWKGLFVNAVAKEWSSTAICRIYDFESNLRQSKTYYWNPTEAVKILPLVFSEMPTKCQIE